MPRIMTVESATAEVVFTEEGEEVTCWRVIAKDATGAGVTHIFPHATLAWRAAEYGIDPADTEALLDVILHEPFLPDLDDPDEAAQDPAARAGMTVPARKARGRIRKGDPVPVRLHNADTIADARQAHLMRIDAIKDTVRIDVPAGKDRDHPLKPIHDTPVDPAKVTDFAGRVDEARRKHRGERIPRNPQPDVPVDETVTRRTREMKEANRA